MRAVVVGTGHIAEKYACTLSMHGIHLAACYDVRVERARAFARRWGAVVTEGLAELLDHSPHVAVNLTSPLEHARVSETLLMLGIPVYSEKPLAHDLAAGHDLIALSDTRNVPLMCAPDILLGGVQRELRRSIDAGLIGRPLFISGQIAWSGHEKWHPDPEFLYREGGGPLLDLGPYWATSMIHLVGPAVAVTAIGSPLRIERELGSYGLRPGTFIPEVPTSVALLIEFRSGVIGSLSMSFDWPFTAGPALQVVGDEGVLTCDTPLFEGMGVVRHRTVSMSGWEYLTPPPPADAWRTGIGVVEMLKDPTNATRRLGKRLALHVLDVLHASARSMTTGARAAMTTTCEHPACP